MSRYKNVDRFSARPGTSVEGFMARWKAMSPERWKKLEKIYKAALPMSQSERRDFLNRVCRDDQELHREAQSLLEADDADNGLLQTSAFALGLKILAQTQTRRDKMKSDEMKLEGRYEILEEIGGGGMGKVYKARDSRVTGRFVVVKVLKEEWLKNEWVVTRFKQEAEILARIDDAGVVGILDAGALPDGQPYLVMQFVEGFELRKFIDKARGGMLIAEVAEIIKHIGRTLEAAHRAGVVHRDLKPGNIMIRRNTSGDLQVKVIDFGIAKIKSEVKNSTVESAPRTEFVVGTPFYMSPEQQLTPQKVTPASDVYSLGVTAYEMLTGKRPFEAASLGHLLDLQKSGEIDKPSDLRSDLPKAVDTVILTALEYQADYRQQSARMFGDELAQALSEMVANESKSTIAPIDQVASRPVPNKRNMVIAAAAIAILLIAIIAGALWWGASGQALASEQVAGVRIETQPSGSTDSQSEKIYDAEYTFPTGKPPGGMVYATIGFTVWRTRPATTRDGEDVARETVDSQEVASERIEDYVSDGERIYLGIESLTGEFMPDRGGYLYVINREQYRDGTFGRARLIFPTLLTYEGRNRVRPGQPILLPEKNRPFMIRRSGANQAAETYTIILSPWEFKLPYALGNKAMELPDDLIADWERQYGGRMHRATLRGGVGQTRTKREQTIGSRATIDTAEALTRDDPLPQTCYRGAVKMGSPAMVMVALRFKE